MKVELLSLTQTVLIVPFKTGIIYTNQVGGTECDHPELEGYVVPVEYDFGIEPSLTQKLCELFPEGGAGIIDELIINKIQYLLDSSPFTKGIEVNKNKLGESKESWLYVNVTCDLEGTIESGSATNAVLTWPNSD